MRLEALMPLAALLGIAAAAVALFTSLLLLRRRSRTRKVEELLRSRGFTPSSLEPREVAALAALQRSVVADRTGLTAYDEIAPGLHPTYTIESSIGSAIRVAWRGPTLAAVVRISVIERIARGRALYFRLGVSFDEAWSQERVVLGEVRPLPLGPPLAPPTYVWSLRGTGQLPELAAVAERNEELLRDVHVDFVLGLEGWLLSCPLEDAVAGLDNRFTRSAARLGDLERLAHEVSGALSRDGVPR